MYYKPSIAIAAAILLSYSCPSGAAIYVLNYLVTKISAPPGALANGHHDELQGGGILQWKISSYNLPAVTYHHQMEADNIRDVYLKHLHQKMP